MLALLRQAVYGRIAGHEDANDADYLRVDPAMRRVVGGRAEKKLGPSTSEMGRFATEFLPAEDNLKALSSLCRAWVDRVHGRRSLTQLVLDMDSSESSMFRPFQAPTKGTSPMSRKGALHPHCQARRALRPSGRLGYQQGFQAVEGLWASRSC